MVNVDKLSVVYKSVSVLIPYDKNPRINDKAVKYVRASIEQFGFKIPIVVDENDVIVCGHTRLKAAKEIGLEEVPCIVASDLTPEQIRAFRVADNKVGEMADWDEDVLASEIADLPEFDFGDFGFDVASDLPPSDLDDNSETDDKVVVKLTFAKQSDADRFLNENREKIEGLYGATVFVSGGGL